MQPKKSWNKNVPSKEKLRQAQRKYRDRVRPPGFTDFTASSFSWAEGRRPVFSAETSWCGSAPFCVSGLISRLKYPVSRHQKSAPSTAGLGYGKLSQASLIFPGCRA